MTRAPGLRGPAILSIHDATGARVRVMRIRDPQSAIMVSLAGLQPGVYLCRLTGSDPAAGDAWCRLLKVR